MNKLFNSYLSNLFGFVGFISLFVPVVKMEYKIIFSLVFSTFYFLVLLIIRQKQNDTLVEVSKNEKNSVELMELQSTYYEEFFHKRKIFNQHDLPKINKISNGQYAYLKDSLRGKKFDLIMLEIKASNDIIEDIIDKEMRDFDEQLFNIQSHKDN